LSKVRTHIVVDSPVGPLTLVADDGVLSALYMDAQRHRPAGAAFGAPGTATAFSAVTGQLEEYFAGDRREWDLPLAPAGSPFQLEVWAALRRVPYGTTASYGQVAATIGRPGAARAVGLANGRNPISIVVPCHRVIGADGSLTGYGGGLERKRQLLDFERATAGTAPAPLFS
jgi:methylated-DNA-[protein]-cysteine S-methyltransferase